MRRSATDGGVSGPSCGGSFSSAAVAEARAESRAAGPGVRGGRGGGGSRPSGRRTGPALPPRCVAVLSALCAAAVVAAVGGFCALLYPVLRELRVERVTGQDGTEQRMLGFWSILVLSGITCCICCIFSWTLTSLDCHQAGVVFPVFPLASLREKPGVRLGYGVAVLNGIMGLLTVIWSLS